MNAQISRSGSIVIAYLMKKFNWSFEKAWNFAKDKRKIAKPNKGF